MQETIVNTLLAVLRNEGSEATIALLLLVVGMALYDRHRIIKKLEKREEKIDQLLDDYYKGTKTLNETITSFKYMLIEIKARM